MYNSRETSAFESQRIQVNSTCTSRLLRLGESAVFIGGVPYFQAFSAVELPWKRSVVAGSLRLLTDRDASTMQFVDAGVTTLVEAPRDILERGLRSEQVVNHAGASQATFFRKFRTKSEFIEAVITSLTESTLHSADKVKQTCAHSW